MEYHKSMELRQIKENQLSSHERSLIEFETRFLSITKLIISLQLQLTKNYSNP